MVPAGWDFLSFIRDCLLNILDVMLGHPIYLIGIGIFITGAVIGLGHRLIRG